MARCLADDAEASGTGPTPGQAPRAGAQLPATLAASSADMGGASRCSSARAARVDSGRRRQYDAIWPIFMSALHVADTSATCSAVRISKRWSSSACRSAGRNAAGPVQRSRHPHGPSRASSVNAGRERARTAGQGRARSVRRQRATRRTAATMTPVSNAQVPLRGTGRAYRQARRGRRRSPAEVLGSASTTTGRPRWRRGHVQLLGQRLLAKAVARSLSSEQLSRDLASEGPGGTTARRAPTRRPPPPAPPAGTAGLKSPAARRRRRQRRRKTSSLARCRPTSRGNQAPPPSGTSPGGRRPR